MRYCWRTRAALERWFYSCGYALRRGLAAYLRDAIYANAARHEG